MVSLVKNIVLPSLAKNEFVTAVYLVSEQLLRLSRNAGEPNFNHDAIRGRPDAVLNFRSSLHRSFKDPDMYKNVSF